MSIFADGLRRRGIDVTTTRDAGLLGAPDSEQLSYANAQQCVIVTMDADFLRLAAENTKHAGIVYCEQGSRTIGQLLDLLVLLHAVIEADEMRGHIEFL